MPAKSKAQQKFMGMVHALQKGELSPSDVSDKVKDVADRMDDKDAEDYASTKHSGKPEHVPKEVVRKLREIIRQVIKENPSLIEKFKLKKEVAERDYKAEYKKFQSSTKAKKYRAELNKYNRQKGTYGNGDGKDASHKGGKIVGFESQSKNRGRAEKSRLKKEELGKRCTVKEVSKWLKTLEEFRYRKVRNVDARRVASFVNNGMNEEELPKSLQKKWEHKKYGREKHLANKYIETVLNVSLKESVNERSAISLNLWIKEFERLAKKNRMKPVDFIKKHISKRKGMDNQVVKDVLKHFQKKESVNEGKKRYYQQDRVGSAKYTISYHDGKKKHKDGSDFFDIKIFRNKKDLAKFVNTLSKSGYVYGFNESVNERISVSDERHFGKKGIIIMIDDNGKKVSAIFKDKKNANKFNRNKPADIKKLLQLAKKTKYPKAIDESVNEAVEPTGNIKKVLDVAKNKQAKKIGGTLVDLTTSSMMTQVWDKVNDSSKEKMNKMNTKQLINLILKLWDRMGTPRV